MRISFFNFYLPFTFSLFFIFVILFFKVSFPQDFFYRDICESYLDGDLQISNTYFYNLNVQENKDRKLNNITFYLKGIGGKTEFSEKDIIFVNILKDGFKVSFTTDENMNVIYSPNFDYFWENNHNYKEVVNKYGRYKTTQVLENFSKSIFQNFIDWFGFLRGNKVYTDLIKFYFSMEYSFYYQGEPSNVNFNLGKLSYKAIFYKGSGNVTNIDDSFSGFKLKSGKISSYEYYDYESKFPLLLQRDIILNIEVVDPELLKSYYQKNGKTWLSYRIVRTLQLTDKR